MEVIFNFKGEINNKVLRSILKTMDEKMATIGEQRFVRKKINSILIECLQNLIFHAEKGMSSGEDPSLEVQKTQGFYQIKTSNLIKEDKAETLGAYIDKINDMDKEELREYYQQVLTNGQFGAQGGAGLGILNIARKTRDHKLQYNFIPLGGEKLLFQMEIRV